MEKYTQCQGEWFMRKLRLNQNRRSQRLYSGLLLLLVASTLLACNPEEAIQQYFAQKGLNPLAILRN